MAAKNTLSVLILTSFLSLSCNGSKAVTTNMIMSENEINMNKDELHELGVTAVYALEKKENKVFLGFVPYARIFSLALDMQNADAYLCLLEASKKSGKPVKIYLFPQTNDVAFVENASKEEIETYNKLKNKP